jgi:NTE family protein
MVSDNFSLVLSGGGALGIAHLGVLHDMEHQGIVPSEIVGTSMGGIVGACAAIGMQESNIHKLIKKFSSVQNWLKFSFDGNAIIDNEKIEGIFDDIFGTRSMKETDIPLKLIATNLRTGHKRVFTGDDEVMIKDALLCTMAIPGIFDEHIVEGEHYADGFLCENLGISAASFPKIIAIDVLGEHSFEKEMPDNFFKSANVLEMFEKSLRLLIYNQTQTLLRSIDKNITLIEPDTKKYKTFHFHKVDEIRSLGLGLLKELG